MFWIIATMTILSLILFWLAAGDLTDACKACGEDRRRKHLIEGRCAPNCWTRQALIDGDMA